MLVFLRCSGHSIYISFFTPFEILCLIAGEQFPVVGAVEGRASGGGAEGGALVGHPSDAIFDQFPECNTVPPLGQWIACAVCMHHVHVYNHLYMDHIGFIVPT